MGNAITKSVRNAVNHVKTTIVNTFRRIAPPIIQYVVAHPFRTLCYMGKIVLLIAPGVIFSPLLGIVGFTGSGIAAGSLEAGLQSMMGTVQAGSAFAVLQSAAMGGYGAATVATVAGRAIMAAEAIGAAGRP